MSGQTVAAKIDAICNSCPLPDCTLPAATTPTDCQTFNLSAPPSLQKSIRQKKYLAEYNAAHRATLNLSYRMKNLLHPIKDHRIRPPLTKAQTAKKLLQRQQKIGRELYLERKRIHSFLRSHYPEHNAAFSAELKLQMAAAKQRYIDMIKPTTRLPALRHRPPELKTFTLRAFYRKCKFITLEEYVKRESIDTTHPPRVRDNSHHPWRQPLSRTAAQSKIVGGMGADFGVMFGGKGVTSEQKLKEQKAANK